jgi:hypothetical protein
MFPQVVRAGGGGFVTAGTIVGGDGGGRDAAESLSEKFFDPSHKRAVPTEAV